MENEINNNAKSFHDMIMGIKKIDAIVVVDDVRTLTDEDIDRIRNQVAEDKKNYSKDQEDKAEK